MSSKKDSGENVKKKGKGLMFKLLLGVVLIGAGGGGAYALVSSGMISAESAKKDDKPKLVRKGEAQLNKGQPVSWTHART